MRVADANAGSFKVTVLAALISDSKKRFCFGRPGASGPQDLFPCLSLHRQSCLKGADWEKNKGVCSRCALNTNSLQRFPKFPKSVNQD